MFDAALCLMLVAPVCHDASHIGRCACLPVGHGFACQPTVRRCIMIAHSDCRCSSADVHEVKDEVSYGVYVLVRSTTDSTRHTHTVAKWLEHAAAGGATQWQPLAA